MLGLCVDYSSSPVSFAKYFNTEYSAATWIIKYLITNSTVIHMCTIIQAFQIMQYNSSFMHFYIGMHHYWAIRTINTLHYWNAIAL